MAHVHMPDGAFSLQFLILWRILATVLITALFLARRHTITAERLSITAMVAAASFVIFQVNTPLPAGVG